MSRIASVDLKDMKQRIDVAVAGHICLDIIPTLSEEHARSQSLVEPGRLVQVGPASIGLGGCVANTGLALHHLGASARLIGKLGDDLLGRLIVDCLEQHTPGLSNAMIVAPGEATSYTVVLNPPGIDRGFLHCPGANDTFSAKDLNLETLSDARIIHFGYPPLMRSTTSDGGASLAEAFHYLQAQGSVTSLDMAMPDTTGRGPGVDWRAWLQVVLPGVDLVLPSLDEILLMLDQDAFRRAEEAATGHNLATVVDPTVLGGIAEQLIGMGTPIVVIKLGDEGLYLHTSEATSQLLGSRARWQDFDWRAWDGIRAICPCLDVDVAGTTGAGDCTIAGVLMSLLQGLGPAQTLAHATAVGAWCVQSPDATSNIPAWHEVESSMLDRWPRRTPSYDLNRWTLCGNTGAYIAQGQK